MAKRSLSTIFKAYDVRGIVPDELDARVAYAIGAGFGRFASSEGQLERVLVARDMRTSGEELARGLMAGLASAGVHVIDLGLASTDLLYFASGHLSSPGVMLTASHNPSQYNGMKFCLAGARPVGQESGLLVVREVAEEVLEAAPQGSELAAALAGVAPERQDLLDAFANHVRGFVDLNALVALRVVADAANGMGGLVAPAVFAGLPFCLDMLYGELDGTFPNHPADPIQVENLADLRKRILETRADVGLAFDGDADRVFLVDELGEPLSGSTTTAMVASVMLERHPGATILYNCICSKAVPEIIREHGGTGVRTRVGHSFIKAVMAETGALFGGEHSGHYYFRENYRADSGIIAALVVLELLSRSKTTLSDLRRRFERYSDSGEINMHVEDPQALIERVAARYRAQGASIDRLDGLTADFGEWWFNLRPSNTEPLVRLNVEAGDPASLARRVEEVVGVVGELAVAPGA
jgi:phosphomannomutase